MKTRGFCAFAAALLAMTQLPMQADAAGDVPKENICTPLYPLENPAAAWLDLIFPEGAESIDIRIVQHSEERTDLVLYALNVSDAPADYVMRAELESGDYTVEMTTKLLNSREMLQTQSVDITVENPDYAPDLTFTYYDLYISETEISDDTEFGSHAEAAVTETDYSNALLASQRVYFNYYARMRGDYDGNGQISASDAQSALMSAAKAITQLEDDKLTPGRLAACDMNHNGVIEPKESLDILRYFAAGMTGNDQIWAPSVYIVK